MRPAVARFYWRNLGEAGRVLDLGCGDGGLAAVKPAASELHALDINPELVRGLPGYESATRWDLDNDEPFPFPDAYFDAIVAKDILEHLQKPWNVLSRLSRVLRPGGIVLASVICYRSRRVWSDYTHVRGFTEKTAARLFEDAGFQIEKVWRMGGVPLSARLDVIHVIPAMLRIPPFDWVWTSSYELIARKPHLPGGGVQA
jgi:SAM-dependent methyltransferase